MAVTLIYWCRGLWAARNDPETSVSRPRTTSCPTGSATRHADLPFCRQPTSFDLLEHPRRYRATPANLRVFKVPPDPIVETRSVAQLMLFVPLAIQRFLNHDLRLLGTTFLSTPRANRRQPLLRLHDATHAQLLDSVRRARRGTLESPRRSRVGQSRTPARPTGETDDLSEVHDAVSPVAGGREQRRRRSAPRSVGSPYGHMIEHSHILSEARQVSVGSTVAHKFRESAVAVHVRPVFVRSW